MRFNSVLPNNFTFPPLFKSLSDTRHVTQAQCVHTHVLKLGHHQDLCVRNSILDVYPTSHSIANYAGFVPNRVTMINALHACAHYGNVEMGAWIRGVIKREGWELDMVLGMALIDITEKDGVKADEVTLLAVLTACSHSGLVDKGREIFGLLVDGRDGRNCSPYLCQKPPVVLSLLSFTGKASVSVPVEALQLLSFLKIANH
ncbi:Pentatricopeptide repeat-containing protein [Glycine soja]